MCHAVAPDRSAASPRRRPLIHGFAQKATGTALAFFLAALQNTYERR
jgi:hypothetical protein